MAQTVNPVLAKQILERATLNARTSPITHPWVALVDHLTALTADVNRTHVAMLGTALLAKATNPAVDAYAVKVRAGTPGAYSARSLATEVLAAEAQRLEIDLGVSGREPLNNMPYFQLDRVIAGAGQMNSKARAAFDWVRHCLGLLDPMTSEEAELALQAFIQVRVKSKVARAISSTGSTAIIESAFATAIALFVQAESEGGRRAQAVTAGIFDVVYGEGVLVARVNDPDRHFPGDVAVSASSGSGSVSRAFEVRDKPVRDTDLYHFVAKAADRGVSRAAVVAVSPKQGAVSLQQVEQFAAERGVTFKYLEGWSALLNDALFWADEDPIAMLEGAGGSILARLEEIEASPESIDEWLERFEQIERLPD